MVRIRLESPAFQRDVDVDDAEPLVEVEGMTWARAGRDRRAAAVHPGGGGLRGAASDDGPSP